MVAFNNIFSVGLLVSTLVITACGGGDGGGTNSSQSSISKSSLDTTASSIASSNEAASSKISVNSSIPSFSSISFSSIKFSSISSINFSSISFSSSTFSSLDSSNVSSNFSSNDNTPVSSRGQVSSKNQASSKNQNSSTTFSSSATLSSSVKSSSSIKSSAASSVTTGTGFVSQHGRLSTLNGRLVDQNSKPIQLHGMSTHGLQWFGQFANKDSIKWLRDDWNANVIRAAMYIGENGYLTNETVINKVWETIDAAIALDIYVIVDWHISTDGFPNPLTKKEEAKTFFKKVTAKYGNDPHIIYEIANEPSGNDVHWSNAIKPYANELIPVIRQGAPDAFVIVGTAVWSQLLNEVVGDELPFNNVAYTIHFYSCEAAHQAPLRKIVKDAAEKNLPIFSTEWGNSEASGNGGTCKDQTDQWLDLLDQYGISWVNWSLSDKNETSAALKSGASATGGWTTAQLTDSGNYVRNRMKGYKQDSSSSAMSTPSSVMKSSSVVSVASSKSSVITTPSSSSTQTTSKSASSSSSVIVGGARLENPFVGAKWYVNQDWAANARAFGGSKIAGYNTAVWMDRIGAIDPADANVLGLRGHLDATLDQGANVFLVVIYDLPNRDCNALASNGELLIAKDGFNRYKNEYVDPIAAILSDAKYQGIRIIAIIEPDSLPNLVTNTSVAKCQESAGKGGYVEATQYTLNKLYPITNVYSYMDIGHSGWLGWDDNMGKATTFIADAIKGTTAGVNSVAGFVSNTANSTPLKEPFLDSLSMSAMPGNGGTQVRQAKFYEWNPKFSELAFVQNWRTRMIALGLPSSIGMLVDTSRNGWGGPARPTALSTSSDVDTFVNQSRIDRRTHRGMWCNQASGIGERPTAAPEPGVDAYVWVKPPGESDGVATAGIVDPTDPAKGFDRFCDPSYTVPSTGLPTGALAGAPHAGRWFTEGFKVLLENAYPAL
jgi:cellulose 1,4-beta-cellobiosidase